MDIDLKKKLKRRARSLRKNQTDVEKQLWNRLRARRLGGYKFYRQFVIENYIVDFVCREQKLIIELDGGQHQDSEPYDIARTETLSSMGYRVVRYWNNQVAQEIDSVLADILNHLKE